MTIHFPLAGNLIKILINSKNNYKINRYQTTKRSKKLAAKNFNPKILF